MDAAGTNDELAALRARRTALQTVLNAVRRNDAFTADETCRLEAEIEGVTARIENAVFFSAPSNSHARHAERKLQAREQVLNDVFARPEVSDYSEHAELMALFAGEHAALRNTLRTEAGS